MKVYKERQFLIFDFEDGKTVKYDFATKECIGKKGKPVKNLCSQLSGISMDNIIECCVDKKYAKFLAFIKRKYSCQYSNINNIGTILDKVPIYAKYEQFFSAGIEDIIENNFAYTINDIPKALIKLCQNHYITLSNNFLRFYKQNPDAYQLAYKLEYISLSDSDILDILTVNYDWYDRNTWKRVYESYFIKLLNEYGYTPKGLLNYLDYCKTFEAMDSMTYLVRELYDYARMMKQISDKFDKYPRHFLTTHKIASRNYNRLKKEFPEELFKKQIDKNMEKTFGEYKFFYPTCTQDIKDEATQMSNCVSSYIQKVIDGDCHILFLRYKDRPNESLVTIEVRNGVITQALQKYNHPLTKEQKEIVNKWNSWYANKKKEDDESVEIN